MARKQKTGVSLRDKLSERFVLALESDLKHIKMK
jgi:hypothetical protein